MPTIIRVNAQRDWKTGDSFEPTLINASQVNTARRVPAYEPRDEFEVLANAARPEHTLVYVGDRTYEVNVTLQAFLDALVSDESVVDLYVEQPEVVSPPADSLSASERDAEIDALPPLEGAPLSVEEGGVDAEDLVGA